MPTRQFSGGSTTLTISTGFCELFFEDVPGEEKKIGTAVNCTKPSVSLEKNWPTFASKFKAPTEFTFKQCKGFDLEFVASKEYFLQEPGQEYVIPLYKLPDTLSAGTAGFIGVPAGGAPVGGDFKLPDFAGGFQIPDFQLPDFAAGLAGGMPGMPMMGN